MVLQSWMQLSNLAWHPPNHYMESQRAAVNEGDTEGMGREEREEAQRDGWFLDPCGLSSAEHHGERREVGSKGAGESALVAEADDATVFLRAV